VGPGPFETGLRRYNARPPVHDPHIHHCGERGKRYLSAVDSGHMYNCPCLGGNIAPHDAVKFCLAHAVKECGLVAAVPKTEVPIQVGQGWWNADIRFITDGSGRIFVVDVSLVNVDSATQLRRGGDAGDVEAALMEREAEKRALPAARQIIDDQGSNTTFVPFVMSSAGGFGPAARKFLKFLFKVARERGKWNMAGLPHLHSTWATMYASSYWSMRLSMACSVTSAEVVGRLVVRDENLNMATDPGRRQPHPDPNANAYGRQSWDRAVVVAAF